MVSENVPEEKVKFSANNNFTKADSTEPEQAGIWGALWAHFHPLCNFNSFIPNSSCEEFFLKSWLLKINLQTLLKILTILQQCHQ